MAIEKFTDQVFVFAVDITGVPWVIGTDSIAILNQINSSSHGPADWGLTGLPTEPGVYRWRGQVTIKDTVASFEGNVKSHCNIINVRGSI